MGCRSYGGAQGWGQSGTSCPTCLTCLTLVLTLQSGCGGFAALPHGPRRPSLFQGQAGTPRARSGHHSPFCSPMNSGLISDWSQIIFPLFPRNPLLFRVPHSPAGPCILHAAVLLGPGPYSPASGCSLQQGVASPRDSGWGQLVDPRGLFREPLCYALGAGKSSTALPRPLEAWGGTGGGT